MKTPGGFKSSIMLVRPLLPPGCPAVLSIWMEREKEVEQSFFGCLLKVTRGLFVCVFNFYSVVVVGLLQLYL